MSTEKTILVTACGSSIGLEVLRSLKLANRPERIIGTEVSWWGKEVAAPYCDQVFILPRGDEARYPDALLKLLQKQSVDLVFINTDAELEAIAGIRDQVTIPASAPGPEGLAACLNKEVLHARVNRLNITASTLVVNQPKDIDRALSEFGSPVWLRCAEGPRGRGSIIVEKAADGQFWMNYWRSRQQGKDVWLAHEYLPGGNFNWTSIWKDGALLTSSTGERLKYFQAEVAVSGITGNVSHCRTVMGDGVNDVSIASVMAIEARPNGIYSVDLKEDRNGRHKVTEINGRQAFRPLLYARSGANFSSLFIDAFLNRGSIELKRTDAADPGMEMIRGMDMEPLFRSSQSGN